MRVFLCYVKTERRNLYDLDRPALAALLAEWGYSDYHAGLLWRALYRNSMQSLKQESGLRADLVAHLESGVRLVKAQLAQQQQSSDGTIKFLLHLADGEMVETVLMPYRDRFTACLSTQVGCAMGCIFCATGQMGFVRHLSAGEIVAQILFLRDFLQNEKAATKVVRNIVFMGMGEPLHNYEATMTAVDIMTEQNGLSFAPRHITVSTVGLVPAIRRLAREERPFNLAVSLHGVTDEERNQLVPLGKRWPLAELMAACRDYVSELGRRIFFEWTLIAGKNDTAEQARALGALLQGMDAHVNLIPLNPTTAYAGRPSRPEDVARFQETLAGFGLPSTVRQRRGLDILAGCGQLRASLPEPI